jgi:hypothetical protein
MRKLLLATTALLALSGMANADVVLTDKLSGTGDNVIFDSLVGNLAVGSFNGQHTGFVDFTDLSGNPLFTGAQNGNDIKISNTNNLQVQVFDSSLNAFGTTTQVFSLKGTGDVTAFMFAVDANGVAEAAQVFDLGVIDPNAQSGFTFQAINGEVMTRMVLLDTGGSINDYEHYRIDAAPLPVAAVPEMGTWGMMLLGFAGIGLTALRRRNSFRLA